MACSLTKGRLDFSCKTLIGGISNIYVAAFDAGNFSAITAGKVTVTALTSLYQFELLNDGNTFDESNEVAKDAGTSTFTQTGTFVLKGQDDLSQIALQDLANARTQVIVEYRDGSMRVAGLDFGADFTIGTTSGGAIGDMIGYNVAFTSVSANLAPFIDTISGATLEATIDPVA
jgi:hypothetical protein